MFHSSPLIARLVSLSSNPAPRRANRRRPGRPAGRTRLLARLTFESLESRWLPSSFTEFPLPTPGSFPAGIIVGGDSNLWFSEELSDKIGRITTAGAITEFPVPLANTRPWGIAAGPDGNVWFATEGDGVAGQVGRITPAGVMTLFPILPAFSYPDLVAGPDGNLWVTESNNNEIARVSPQGVLLSQFTIPVSGAAPEFIVAGPDGNMWFTVIGGWSPSPFGPAGIGYVGSVSVSGNFTMFAMPSTPNSVKGMSTGPDGDIWFLEQYPSVNKVGRLTPSGVLTEFTVPTPNSLPTEIRPGPDGNLCFTESGANQIASITPGGVITEYAVPTPNSNLGEIVTGPDGNL